MRILMTIVMVIAAVVVLVGILHLPIRYYTFLRIVVCAASVAVVVAELKQGSTGWAVVFMLIGLLFNPIAPVYLHNKPLWQKIDFITGVLFLVKAFLYHSPKATEK